MFAGFLVQGLPYWDCDYSINFLPGYGVSLLRMLLSWISPVYSGVQNWGFLDRTASFIIYKLCYFVAGYDSWPYLIVKSVCFALLAVMIYVWALKVAPESRSRRAAALLVAMFFVVTPGSVASLVWLADSATIAELAFLVLTLLIWRQVEATPADWTLCPIRTRDGRTWLFKWIGLSIAVYLAYKLKGDLKLIPLILAAYIGVVRPKQWKLFALPVACMLLLAVPWNGSALSSLPPFVPGSKAVTVGYSWQPASFATLREFIWSSQPYSFMGELRGGTFSLAGLLGPFLLSALIVFLGWRVVERFRHRSDFAPAPPPTTPESRARWFMLIWLVFILGATSVLPAINDFFRIRWSILPLVPACILLAWPVNLFLEMRARLPVWATAAAAILFAVQGGIDLNRSLWHRRELGQVMVSIDKAYDFVDKNYPADECALWPGFLSYAYHPDASPALRNRDPLSRPEDLALRHKPDRTTVISWQPVLSPQMDVVKRFSGCNPGVLFDAMIPCNTGTVVMRYIAPDATFQTAVTAQSHGDLTQARQLLQQFMSRHPDNDGARLQLARVECQGREWNACDRSLAELEASYPNDMRVLHDRAFALLQLKQYDRATALLKRVIAANGTDFGAQALLAQVYRVQGKTQDADKVVAALRDRMARASANDPVAAAEMQARQMPTPENFLSLSLQYHRAGRFQDCIAAARQALKLRPSYAEAWNNIAAGYQSMGRWDEAIEAAQQALRLKPDFQLARNNLAWSMSQKAQRK